MSDQASTLLVNTLEPQSGTTLTVGKSGQNLVVNADSLKANVAKDAGGNALFTSDGSGSISGVNSAFGSAEVLLTTQTPSNSATIEFTSGIDSTYKEYIFRWSAINPATDDADFGFQVNASGETGYNEAILSTAFRAYNEMGGSSAALVYDTASDQYDGSTGFQRLNRDGGNDVDQCSVGEMHLYNPASTTFVKNWWSISNVDTFHNYTGAYYIAGFFNITVAITQVQFKMSSGNFDGTIKMYGIK